MNEIKEMPPQNTWFFEDSTGRIFPTNEKEAFSLLTENSRWRRQDIKMIGMSDGKTYHETLTKEKQGIQSLVDKIKELRITLDRYIKGHDKLIFEDFLEQDDPKVIRANAKISELEKEISPLEKELQTRKADILKTAFDAELEKARGNIVKPKDFTVITRNQGGVGGENFLENFKNAKRVL
jgi:hypothetical protein